MMLPKHEPIRWFTPDMIGTYSTGSGNWVLTDAMGNAPDVAWEITANTGGLLSMNYRQTIDLGGLMQNYLTFNPLSYFVQRWSAPGTDLVGAATGDTGVTISQQWVTSTKPIPSSFNINEWTYTNTYGPSYDELIGYHTEIFVNDTTGASTLMTLRDAQTLGALQATTAAKLYTLFRIVVIPKETSVNAKQVGIAPAVVTIAQEIAKEKNLEYIMRTARAYDH